MKMKDLICKMMRCPVFLFTFLGGASLFSLAAALTAELAFGLEPCVLCIYQRIPFVIVIALSLLGLVCRQRPQVVFALLGLCAAAFLANAGIAFYHTGVEQHWWLSAVEGCAVPDFSGGTQNMLENLLSAPTASCNEIPWADPILGLSMANYNIVLCFGLFVIAAIGALQLRPRPSSE